MFSFARASREGGDVFRPLEKDEAISFARFFDLLQVHSRFVDAMNSELVAYAACHWELPGLRVDDLGNEAEFAVVKSEALASLRADPSAFAEHFERSASGVAVFANFGGSSQLIAPCPNEERDYAHLSAFLRNAPEGQMRRFWRRVAQTYISQLGHTERWLSTAGLGVPWLHARIDPRPKYYQYRPYAGDL